jgi:beta-lactamase class A
MITRRKFTGVMAGAMLGATIAGVASTAFGKVTTASSAQRIALAEKLRTRLAQIEAGVGGRLGVAILDTASGLQTGRRMDEAFPMCSTFKFLAAATVLARVDSGQEDLNRRIVFSKSDLQEYSPITQHHVGGAGMSVAELCEAAITLSDNTAANLLLASFGGPAGLTAFARSLGDKITRLDRNEPSLNESTPGDPRDTTTPNAMLGDMRKLLLTDRLSASSRAQLMAWMIANKTADKRIRAKLPSDWRVGDKTGSGDHGSTNDIAILWPPGRDPILVTVYLTDTTADASRRDGAIAEVGLLIASSL